LKIDLSKINTTEPYSVSEGNYMRRLLVIFAIACLTFGFAQPAWADVAAGGKVFAANCASCHLGGKNLVNPAKTLKLADLQKYEMNSTTAIVTQVTNGKAAMPSFKGRLTADQIADVAAFVVAQAEKGW
jgi:cytochrome c6